MKHGKRPTKKHKIIIQNAGYNPANWLVTKNLPNEIHIVHRVLSNVEIIKVA